MSLRYDILCSRPLGHSISYPRSDPTANTLLGDSLALGYYSNNHGTSGIKVFKFMDIL